MIQDFWLPASVGLGLALGAFVLLWWLFSLPVPPVGKVEVPSPQDWEQSTILTGTCSHCFNDGVALFPSPCDERPELYADSPIGMYHCPDCGTMVLAGVPHPPVCKECVDTLRGSDGRGS